MNLDQVEFLISDRGHDALSELGPVGDSDVLDTVLRLRRAFSPEESSALIQTAQLRVRARAKFSRADLMLFTDEALQQATAEPVARHRAERFRKVTSVMDLGCGIGGDAIALAAVATATAVDLDPVRSRMAAFNASVYGVELGVAARDLLDVSAAEAEAFFCDPSRRDDRARRVFEPAAYRPPLAQVVDRFGPELAVKVHPGIAHRDLPRGAEAEYVSLNRELRECTLWFGSLASAASRRATLLPQRVSMVRGPESDEVGVVGAFLHEPDPAVIRAGLIPSLAAEIGARRLDPNIAYLTTEKAVSSPFVVSFVVEEVMAFSLKRVKAYLRQAGVGAVEIKKRGSSVEPEALRRQLALVGDQARVLFVTRAAARHTAIIAHRE